MPRSCVIASPPPHTHTHTLSLLLSLIDAHRYLDNDPQKSLIKYAREGDATATPQFCAAGKIFAQKTLEQEHEERQKKVEKT